MEFAPKGINKALFQRVLEEVKNKKDIVNLKAYLRGCLKTVLYRIQVKQGIIDPMEKIKHQVKNSPMPFFDWLSN